MRACVPLSACVCVCVLICMRGTTGEVGTHRKTAQTEKGTDMERQRRKEGQTRPSFSIQGGGVDR